MKIFGPSLYRTPIHMSVTSQTSPPFFFLEFQSNARGRNVALDYDREDEKSHHLNQFQLMRNLHYYIDILAYVWNEGMTVVHFKPSRMFFQYLYSSITVYVPSNNVEFFAGYTRIIGHFVGVYLTKFFVWIYQLKFMFC